MKTKQNDADGLDTAMRGARAVIDYSGLVTWSILSRSCCAIKNNASKMGKRIVRNMADPFVAIKSKSLKVGGGKKVLSSEATRHIEGRIATIEKRLASLEKHGARSAASGEYQKKHKELDNERRGLLALIVEENKELKSLLNK